MLKVKNINLATYYLKTKLNICDMVRKHRNWNLKTIWKYQERISTVANKLKIRNRNLNTY